MGSGPTSARLVGAGRTAATIAGVHAAGVAASAAAHSGGSAALLAIAPLVFAGTGVASGSAVLQAQSAPHVGGLKIWLKSDAGLSVSGSNVTAWADQSGSGNNFTTGAGTPVLVSGGSGINGLPVVRFNNAAGANRNANCYLTRAINPSSWAGLTVIYVLRTAPSSSPSSPIIDSYDATFSIGGRFESVWWSMNTGTATDGSGVGWAGSTGALGLGNYSPAPTNSQIIYEAYRYDKIAWTMSGQFSATVADTSFPTGTVDLYVGTGNLNGSQSTADIAEILVYDHALSSAELATTRGYVTFRYAV